MLVLLFLVWDSTGQNFPTRENQVRAVFLFNFTQFVEWPAHSFSGPDSPFVIGILGNDPFGNYLDQTVAGEKVMNHSLVVRRYRDVKDLQPCHILFIGVDDPVRTKELMAALPKHSTLTVSDSNNFAKAGGMIGFFTKDNKTRLRINLAAAKSADLNISSKLLRVAEITE